MKTEKITVAATPTLLFTATGDHAVDIENAHASNDFYVGGADVAATGATQGKKVAAGGDISIVLNGFQTVYAITASGTSTAVVLSGPRPRT